jgi:hypothetical protein
MSVVFPLWLKANGQVLMAGFLWLDTICDPYGGSAMIAWLQAFLGLPPPAWDSRITKPALLLLPVQCDGSPLPLPARTLSA